MLADRVPEPRHLGDELRPRHLFEIGVHGALSTSPILAGREIIGDFPLGRRSCRTWNRSSST
jgi:hypothetical protein